MMTQGRGDRDEWVTDYALSYSQDAYRWDFINDTYGNKKVSNLQYSKLSSNENLSKADCVICLKINAKNSLPDEGNFD
jgi:hypothetical protein